LALFVVSTLVILSFYGGGFSTVPAYLKDLFGVYQVGAIHGRLLTAWSAAGVAGPLLVNSIVESTRASGGEGFELYRPSLFLMAGILVVGRSEEHTSELQSRENLVCRLLLEK